MGNGVDLRRRLLRVPRVPKAGLVALYSRPPTGAVARVRADRALEEPILWLWRLAALHWAALNEARNQLTALLQRSTGARKSLRRLRADLETLRHSRVAFNRLRQDAAPENLADEEFQRYVYGSIWRAWNGDALVRSFDEQVALNDFVLNSRQTPSSADARRERDSDTGDQQGPFRTRILAELDEPAQHQAHALGRSPGSSRRRCVLAAAGVATTSW